MAKPVKRLRDLLQEKQEPFVLDRYLLEKGYLKKRFDSSHSLKSCDLERSQKGSLQCSKVLKAVCNQVTSFNEKLGIKNSGPRDWRNYETEEFERFSSSTCSASDSEETSTSQQKSEVVTERKLQCQCTEESRELSPVSVLEELPSNRDGTKNSSSIKQKKSTVASSDSIREVTEDSILSASLWKVLLKRKSEFEELVHCNPNLKSKKVLQQTRQLLFDCVGEIVETQKRKKRQHQQEKECQYFGAQDFGKLIEEKIGCWGKQNGEGLNFTQLPDIDLGDSGEEWRSYKAPRRRIGCEIGDAILEEMVHQVLVDMVGF